MKRVGAVLFSGLVGTTACLTVWQLQRYSWKLQLIDDRGKVLKLEPRPLRELVPEPASGHSASAEYTRVVCEGEFDHAKQVLLGPRSAPPVAGRVGSAPIGAPTQSGWDVLTPFTCVDGSRVLVNRGWVPRDAIGSIKQPCGRQQVAGILKCGEKENKYGSNDIASKRYLWLDLPTLAATTASDPVLIVAADDESQSSAPSADWPRMRPLSSFMTFYVEPNTHLVRVPSNPCVRATCSPAFVLSCRFDCPQVYASTWGSLTVAGAFMTFKRFLR